MNEQQSNDITFGVWLRGWLLVTYLVLLTGLVSAIGLVELSYIKQTKNILLSVERMHSGISTFVVPNIVTGETKTYLAIGVALVEDDPEGPVYPMYISEKGYETFLNDIRTHIIKSTKEVTNGRNN